MSQPRLQKPKPEHMAVMKAIAAMKAAIKDMQLRIMELQATLPLSKPAPRQRKGENILVHPRTGKKFYW